MATVTLHHKRWVSVRTELCGGEIVQAIDEQWTDDERVSIVLEFEQADTVLAMNGILYPRFD